MRKVVSAVLILLLSGCAMNNPDDGTHLPQTLQAGSTYRIEVVNPTPCEVALRLGETLEDLSRFGDDRAITIGSVSPYQTETFDFAAVQGRTILMALPVGEENESGACNSTLQRPSIRLLTVLSA